MPRSIAETAIGGRRVNSLNHPVACKHHLIPYMNIFPASDSTLSPAHIAVFVKATYRAGKVVTASILKTGINHTYLITADSVNYIFRVYSFNWRTALEIGEEIRLLNLLKENNIPVSYPIKDTQSTYIQELDAPEGKRYAVLFSFAPGGKMFQFPAVLHKQAGKIMAEFHKVSCDLQLDRVHYTVGILIDQPYIQLLKFLQESTEEMRFIKSLQRYLHDIFRQADKGEVRKGIVHLDIWFDNMSIADNKNIMLFDFDFCGNGGLYLDIAYYILQLYSTEAVESEFLEKRDSFINGYESVTRITEAEKRLLPAAGAAIYLFYLGVQCARYDNWSNVFLNDIYLKRFIMLRVKRWCDFNKLVLPVF